MKEGELELSLEITREVEQVQKNLDHQKARYNDSNNICISLRVFLN